MMIDTVMAFVVVRSHWGWSLPKAAPVFGGLLVIDLLFVSSNLLKIVEGGWFPLAIGAVDLLGPVHLAARAQDPGRRSCATSPFRSTAFSPASPTSIRCACPVRPCS